MKSTDTPIPALKADEEMLVTCPGCKQLWTLSYIDTIVEGDVVTLVLWCTCCEMPRTLRLTAPLRSEAKMRSMTLCLDDA